MTDPASAPPPAAPAPPPAAPPASAPASTTQRPTGITILAVLAGVGGILLALAGISLFVLGAVAFGGLGALLGLAFIAVAALYIAFCVGALQLKPWAWPLGVAGSVASIILSALQLLGGDITQIISIAIAGGILYYLWQPGIKAVFGRA
jgi:hypothetical protein